MVALLPYPRAVKCHKNVPLYKLIKISKLLERRLLVRGAKSNICTPRISTEAHLFSNFRPLTWNQVKIKQKWHRLAWRLEWLRCGPRNLAQTIHSACIFDMRISGRFISGQAAEE